MGMVGSDKGGVGEGGVGAGRLVQETNHVIL